MASFRFGGYDFPDRLIKENGIEIAPNQRQNMDAYTDEDGVTHLNPVPHTKTQIQITTLPMKASDMRSIMNGFTSNYIVAKSRDANCRYFDDEYQTFKTGHFYFDHSFKFNVKEKNPDGTPKLYGEMTWLFIEL